MASTDGVEIQRKFDVDEGARLPAFAALPGVVGVEEPVEYEFDAVYFDTADLALASWQLTLRRRTGGQDAGWRLTTSPGSGAGREFREPLGDDPAGVPERLLRLARVRVRDRALVPVARLQTLRVVHRLVDTHGRALADLRDDRVLATRFMPAAGSETWREWQVELVTGEGPLLDAAQSLLAASGVRPSASVSELARALGDRSPSMRPSAPPRPNRQSSAAEVLLAHIDNQLRRLWQQDSGVRVDEPGSVHRMRIAIRRIRSALATFRPLLDSGASKSLRTELKWLAGEFGAARDLQVARRRLSDLVAAEPPDPRFGSLSGQIDEQLGAEFQAARLAALEALDDGRYFRLLDALDSFLASAPLTRMAARPARDVVPKLVEKEWRRLRARVRDAKKLASGPDRDLALHAVRKAAKRLRYAAKVAGSVRRKPATRLAVAAEELQTILGEHQDSVVARGLLRRWAIEARQRQEDTFGYGRLDALEQWSAADSHERFRRAWRSFPRPPFFARSRRSG